MNINGWISNLTKNTGSARMNFDNSVTDEQLEGATREALYAELRRYGRTNEATPEQWQLKEPIKRDYPLYGKSSARIRFVKVASK